MPQLEYDRYNTKLQAETVRLAEAVQDADPAQHVQPVPPGHLPSSPPTSASGTAGPPSSSNGGRPRPCPTTRPTTCRYQKGPRNGRGGCWPAPAAGRHGSRSWPTDQGVEL